MSIFLDPLLQSRYNIHFQNSESVPSDGIVLMGQDLVRNESLLPFLDAFSEAILSSRGEVTGSLFIKRYVSIIAGAVYAFTYHNHCLDLSLQNMKLVLKKDKLICVVQNTDEPDITSQAESREERRKQLLHHLYHTNIKKVWSAIIPATSINGATLWATLSYLFAYWKEADQLRIESPELLARMEEDYRFIAEHAWDESFTDCPVNPVFSKFDEVDIEGEKILVRAKCCLQFCLPGEKRYCYTCPRITEEERLLKYKASRH